MSGDVSGKTEVVYGEIQNSLVFMIVKEARELAGLRKAMGTSETWGEFQTRVPKGRYEEALERLPQNEEREEGEEMEEPAPEARFAPEEFSGFADGDWPEWPAQDMFHWMPKDVQERFGFEVSTTISGEYLGLPPEKEAEIVAAMRAHGYSCSRDDDLVWDASVY